ncbi:hypothetical protein PsorP6_001504 [Peronosclerospora sorghi]|uniref:Uncharacterized protein n=1 Tax=Peronosclerospora sorghi TaxID=230839 RepID=A0ACC0WSG9_9STRA|nr:hypothetical protein PsorP6_001504 [Peronosclerospora sorghi]
MLLLPLNERGTTITNVASSRYDTVHNIPGPDLSGSVHKGKALDSRTVGVSLNCSKKSLSSSSYPNIRKTQTGTYLKASSMSQDTVHAVVLSAYFQEIRAGIDDAMFFFESFRAAALVSKHFTLEIESML